MSTGHSDVWSIHVYRIISQFDDLSHKRVLLILFELLGKACYTLSFYLDLSLQIDFSPCNEYNSLENVKRET